MQAETIYSDRNSVSVILSSVENETPVSKARARFHSQMAANVRQFAPQRSIWQ
ncbi:hypothetical protein FHW58_001159 [Duganella sp. 1224]|nr:hypothetical protein [Duganella sp. 1224]